jgi:hypothetical protein
MDTDRAGNPQTLTPAELLLAAQSACITARSSVTSTRTND